MESLVGNVCLRAGFSLADDQAPPTSRDVGARFHWLLRPASRLLRALRLVDRQEGTLTPIRIAVLSNRFAVFVLSRSAEN